MVCDSDWEAELARVLNDRGERAPAERSTIKQYERHRDAYLVPLLGEVKLPQLDKPRIMAFRDELLAKYSRAMARKVIASLKGILSEVQNRGRVATSRATKVKVGAGNREEGWAGDVPTVADIEAKLDELATPDGTPIWAQIKL